MVSRVATPFSARRGGATRRRYRQVSVLRTRRRAEPHVAELKVTRMQLLALEISLPLKFLALGLEKSSR